MLHVALSQLRPVKADPAATLDRVSEVFGRVAAADRPPRVLLFPECALTGYFLEGGVRECSLEAGDLFDGLRARWREASDGRPLEVGIGFYERRRDQVYNTAMYAELGGEAPGILHLHRKVFLPTYGVFQEDRFVEPGASVRAFDTAWGRAAILVCEDAWHSLSGTLAALDGAQVVFVVSASPAHGTDPGPGVPGNVERWERLLRGTAEEHGVFVVLSQLTGFEGGKGFPGASMAVGPRGEVLARGPLWEDDLVTASLDLDALLRARQATPLLADLEAALPRILSASADVLPGVGGGAQRGVEERSPGAPAEGAGDPTGGASARAPGGPPSAPRPDPDDASVLEIDPELVEEWLVQFLHQEVLERRGFRRVVVGLSGGVDSSLAALLAAKALGPEEVDAFLLPSDVTSSESREHALAVADLAGFDAREIDITPAVDGYLGEHEPDAGDRRRGNVMARQRMIVLYDQAMKLDALPLGTGNKSERLLGYFTWHADDAAPVNPLGDLFKTQVRQLARHAGVPEEIVEKPPSAELEPGQTDEDDLGVGYREADLVLHHLLRGHGPGDLVECGFDAGVVGLVHDRLEGTHWKRRPPTVAMLSDTSIGDWYLRPVDY
jgi:NAD+ synthetase